MSIILYFFIYFLHVFLHKYIFFKGERRVKELLFQQEENKKTLTKEMEILQQNQIAKEVKKLRSPAAKKAMTYLLDTKTDWDNCMKQFATLLDGDGNLPPVDEDSKDEVDAFLQFFVQFGNKRVRKT